jgi:hypothetical protein
MVLSELFSKTSDMRKANTGGNFFVRKTGFNQERFRLRHSASYYESIRRPSRACRETAGEMATAQIDKFCQLVDRDMLREIPLNVIDNLCK